jgi:hypothetical protein
MITFKIFNLSRLLSQQVAPVCLGRELQGSNVFLTLFGCIRDADRGRPVRSVTALYVFSHALSHLLFTSL